MRYTSTLVKNLTGLILEHDRTKQCLGEKSEWVPSRSRYVDCNCQCTERTRLTLNDFRSTLTQPWYSLWWWLQPSGRLIGSLRPSRRRLDIKATDKQRRSDLLISCTWVLVTWLYVVSTGHIRLRFQGRGYLR